MLSHCQYTYIRFANITRMAEDGIPLTHIQYWAGHSTLRQTEDYVRSVQRPSREEYNSTLLNQMDVNKKEAPNP